MKTIVEGKAATVTISKESPTVIIGERINPTGKKKLAAALKDNNLDYIVQEALKQVEAGAHIIDINVGASGIVEEEVLPEAVRMVTEAVDVPICIDSSKPAALEAALKVCPGRPLLNSTTGEEKSMRVILPLAKDFNVPVIGLTMDEKGIPRDTETRFSIAEKILDYAVKLGIAPEDVLIDVLVMPVGADTETAKVTFETARRISDELGLNIVVGASNVSHGLPDRKVINSTFFALGAMCGMTAYLTDPTVTELYQTILAVDLLLGRDEWATNYIAFYRKKESSKGS
ncbi:5-methyltetrahydrofolate:corrinoid/iron-sulfur protein co-methyltransferase [bacterium BMS3Bbin06]|nr:5-methyltetrahydrofolate:corrinoid/iron-sulfur protein co-methyltransferase [bacterium BMS3Abin08]GBE34774.1 5-methyltetrahydrofolate:corrinoid/iron-sulfur protein co-methyltransferase [bacterium BMS3Bbin06]HDY70996.1 pterin-binding protein [Nitrospirota bacterium]